MSWGNYNLIIITFFSDFLFHKSLRGIPDALSIRQVIQMFDDDTEYEKIIGEDGKVRLVPVNNNGVDGGETYDKARSR